MTTLRRWTIDMATGFRLAVSGGRSGLLRTVLTAVGIGLAVALLFLAASLPTMLDGRDARAAAAAIAWDSIDAPASDETMLAKASDTRFRAVSIDGYLLQPEGTDPPVPPGLTQVPGPGEMAVSPALADLLESPDGKLLEPRLDYRIVETIGDEGLVGPQAYFYYAGTSELDIDTAARIDHIGEPVVLDGLPSMLFLLALVAITVLLLPVVLFVGIAARFGGERRDRRLAALRLIGADRAMTRRVAAGEALLGGLAGMLVGVVLFLFGRQLVEHVGLMELSVFASDLTPNPVLAVLVLVSIPLVTVGISWLAMRRLMVEPLGVFRQSRQSRRRVWWRLLLPLLGVGFLYLASRFESGTSTAADGMIPLGIVLVLGGVVAMLPWAVETVVNRLRGGPVAWQLATRRLQLGGEMAARAVGGVAVAAAGAIAFQMLFFGVEKEFTLETGIDEEWPLAMMRSTDGRVAVDQLATAVDEIDGVETELSYRTVYGNDSFEGVNDPESASLVYPVAVADCEMLVKLVAVDGCEEGDAFFADGPYADLPAPGQELYFEADEVTGWTVPTVLTEAETLSADGVGFDGGIIVTPSLFDAELLEAGTVSLWAKVDASKPDSIEYLRNIAEPTGQWSVMLIGRLVSDNQFDGIRRGIMVGVIAVMALVGLSVLVGMFEQLQDRRRLLSVLAAFGTKRSAMGWSVLWQVAIPVVLGLVLAIAGGVATGVVLQSMSGAQLTVDWVNLGIVAAAAVGLVAVVTSLSLPLLWRLMRTDGLRTE